MRALMEHEKRLNGNEAIIMERVSEEEKVE